MTRGLILNNPKAAFWVISAFWVFISALIWGPLFSFLGYKVRLSREADEHKKNKEENKQLKEKLFEVESERDTLKAKRKAAQIALA